MLKSTSEEARYWLWIPIERHHRRSRAVYWPLPAGAVAERDGTVTLLFVYGVLRYLYKGIEGVEAALLADKLGGFFACESIHLMGN